MKKLLSLLMMMSISAVVFAQKDFTINGRVVDALMRNELPGATVELLSAKDSSVIESIVADRQSADSERGVYRSSAFSFNVPREEGSSYIIRASYLGFKTECVNVKLDNLNRREHERTLADITLHRESQVLDELEVVGTKVKFYYKGDTVVYNADAFVLAEGSMLDGLVRQMPGMEIREDGNIYHNGKLVEDLLLNGKEFFKGNNQIMLDMLPAFTVQNVKVYDKYGDLSELTGRKQQNDKRYVMDVVLKREYNIGWMGNLEGGGGTSDRYLGRLFAMRHTDHSRVTVYGAINNLNDKRKPGQDTNWTPEQLQGGRSKEVQGGIDYYVSDREGKYTLNGNAQVSHTDMDLVENQDKVNFLPNNDTYEYVRSQSRNKTLNVTTEHSLNLHWKNAGLGLTPTFTYNKYDNRNATLDGIFNEQQTGMSRDILENLYSPTVSDDIRRAAVYRYRKESLGKGHTINGGLRAGSMIKLNSFGDVLSLDASVSGETKHEDMFNRYGTLYGADGTAGPSGYQYFKNRPDKKLNFNVGGYYMYQVNGNLELFLKGAVDHVYRKQHSSLYLLDKLAGTDDYEIGVLPSVSEYEQTFDPRNSFIAEKSDYTYSVTPSVSYHCNFGDGMMFSLSSDLQLAPTHQTLNYHRNNADTSIVRNSLRMMIPFLHSSIAKNDFSFFTQIMGYIKTKTPDLVNMVDMTDDTDPLNVTIGNPDLKDETTYNLNWLMAFMNPKTQMSNEVGVTYQLRTNAFSMGYTYNPQSGVRTYRMDNVYGNWNGNIYYTLNTPLGKKKRLSLWTRLTAEYANSVDLVGESATDAFTATRSSVRTATLKEDLSMSYKIGNSQISLIGSYSWRNIDGGTESFKGFDAMDFHYGASAIVNLPWNMQLSTDLTMFSRRGYEGSSLNTDDLVWNARLSYTTLKGKLTFMLDAFDILNQINNVTRVVNAQGRVETFTNALPRYALLHVAYKFNSAPKKK